MKKIILILSAVTFAISFSNAQDGDKDSRSQLHFGAKAGVNSSNVYDSQGEKFVADPKLGFAAGGFISIPIGKFLGVQPEVMFSQKGFQATGIILDGTYSMTRTTNYLDIPLLFAFKPVSALTILAGPQYSYLMKQTDVFTNGTTSIAQEQVFENDNIRKNTYCFTVGADVNLGHIVIGGRAGWDLQNNNGDGTSSTPRYKNEWYQLTFGFRF
jgi:hypothetical protein